ncbi:transcriptional regulator [Rhizobium sp. YIM 134829]|uniref:transcriptional regulator n=1 Tax=Rhizobium sp. YIM 134829 TaxID=3390453 RepID=UPI003978C532
MTNTPNPKIVTRLLEAAIAIAGSEAKLGKMVAVSQNAIWSAKRKGRVSAELAAGIDRATNGAIQKSQLRPDIFPPSAETSP